MKTLCLSLAAALALAGCTVESETIKEEPKPGVTQAGVLTFATFARVIDDAANIAEGMNIDGIDSSMGDVETCGMLDYTSPDGEKGIDNQFGGLMPTIEKFVGSENIGQLLATAIANGQLLVLLAVDDVDDVKDDPEVTVRIAAGTGIPLLDASGKFITYQTFGVDRDRAPVSKLKGRIKDGVVEFGPGDAILPVRVLDALFNLELHGALGRIQLAPDEQGGGVAMNGMVAGGIEVSAFKDIVKQLNIQDDVMGAASLIGLLADLAPDPETGVCTQVSAALRMETTPAFILDE